MKSGDAVVTKLTVARLFNLGNYEHERIEVTVEARGMEAHDGSHIPDSISSPEIVLAELRHAVECCKPVEKEWEVVHAESIESGNTIVWDGQGDEPMSNYVSSEVARDCLSALATYRAKVQQRNEGFLRLRSLGQVSVNGGAK